MCIDDSTKGSEPDLKAQTPEYTEVARKGKLKRRGLVKGIPMRSIRSKLGRRLAGMAEEDAQDGPFWLEPLARREEAEAVYRGGGALTKGSRRKEEGSGERREGEARISGAKEGY